MGDDLAQQLYAAFRANVEPEQPSWGNLSALDREAWEVVATKARQVEAAKTSDEVAMLRDANAAWKREFEGLHALINSPRVDEFFAAVRIESAHQVERWGVDHDAGKRPEDWLTLFTYLLGKAAKAHFDGNQDKLLHHIITVAAVALNWHRNAIGENTRMRPGIGA